MEALISIIVPIYNSECYLSVCLDSIINQTYKKIEIILIDDGSIDNSSSICLNYEKKDSRIIFIKNEHRGVVETKKIGVENAKGDYCMFVDSDDWIENNLLEEVLKLSDNGRVDIVNYNISTVRDNKIICWKYTISDGIYECKRLERLYKKMIFDFDNGCPGIIQSLCSKLIKRDILNESIKTVDSRITMGDDAAVVYKAMLMASKIVVTNKSYYFYRNHEGSLTTSRDSKIFDRIYYFQQYMSKIFSKYDERLNLDMQLQAYLIHFINKGIKDIYSINLQEIYRIPLPIIRNIGSKVVLYGAGNVGKSYYKQLLENCEVKVIAWIDKEFGRTIYGCEIKSLKIINSLDFDTILIAIKNVNVVEEIRKELYKIVPHTKILWAKPYVNWWEKEVNII